MLNLFFSDERIFFIGHQMLGVIAHSDGAELVAAVSLNIQNGKYFQLN